MGVLVSIIIPVYKVEKYIKKCMQSLLDQTYEGFEALIVNDGSPDTSIELAKSIVGDDPRFIFLEKENGGQGTARNLGLDHAKGDYIAFLDSDDSYTHDMLEVAVNELSKDSSVDILAFGINRVDEQGFLLSKTAGDNSIVSTDDDVLLLNQTLTRYFWDKVYKRQIISAFRFSTEVRTFEDVDLIYQVLYGARIKNISDCLYNYTQREGSTTYSLPPSFIRDKVNIVNNAKDFLIEKSIFEEHKEYYKTFYLDEIFYRPLLKIARYSKNYKHDVYELLSHSNRELLSFKNIQGFKSHRGIKGVLTLSAIKVNKQLLYLIVQLKIAIKKSEKILSV